MAQAIAQNSAPAATGTMLSPWRRPSYRLGTLFGALLCLGLVLVASAAVTGRDAGALEAAVTRRLMWMGAGVVAFVIGCTVNYQRWRRHHVALAGMAFLLLAVVLLPTIGRQVNGARRWIRLGPSIGIQPSEFAKLALVIWVAAYCERCARGTAGGEMGTLVKGFLAPAGVVAVACGLVLLEPDFGTAVLMGAICMSVLLVCGTRPLYVLLAGAAALPALHRLVTGSAYRLERITTFVDPWRDAQGAGYQLVQSLITIGSGGATGQGLGAGPMGFLPAARNDFVFSTLAGQAGFVGAAIVMAAFVWIVWEGVNVARRARDTFGFALAFGISALIGLQAVIHIAVATGSVPTKGLSLPFVSAGGSSLFFTLLAGGILVNVALSEETPQRFELVAWHRDTPEYEHILRQSVRSVVASTRNLVANGGGK